MKGSVLTGIPLFFLFLFFPAKFVKQTRTWVAPPFVNPDNLRSSYAPIQHSSYLKPPPTFVYRLLRDSEREEVDLSIKACKLPGNWITLENSRSYALSVIPSALLAGLDSPVLPHLARSPLPPLYLPRREPSRN